MASREFEALLAAIPGDLVAPGDSLQIARDKLNAVHGHPIANTTAVQWTRSGGVRCAWVDAGPAAAAGTFVLCHGGAYIAGRHLIGLRRAADQRNASPQQ